jgi:hypothetical protein
VLRGDGLLREVLEGRMMGSRPQGRPRMGMIELREVRMKGNRKEKESPGSLKRRAENREGWSFCAEDLPECRKLMMMLGLLCLPVTILKFKNKNVIENCMQYICK